MRITTREQAVEAGQIRYYTGKPCRQGHVTERYTVSCNCVACTQMHSKAAKKATRERFEKARAANAVTETA